MKRAALFAALGYWKQGKNQRNLDDSNIKLNTNSLLKEQIEALETKVDSQSVKMDEQQKEIIELTAKVQGLYDQNVQLKNLLQGRDPQMQELMVLMQKYIETNIPLLEIIKSETIPTIRNMKKYLDGQKF